MDRRLLVWASVSFCFALIACSEAEDPPSLGRIVMEYHGASESDITVEVINGSDRTVYIRVQDASLRGVVAWPSVTDIRCESIEPRTMIEHPFTIADGAYRRTPVVRGERVLLKIRTKIPQQYKDSRCRLTLRLEDGAIVEPLEFRP